MTKKKLTILLVVFVIGVLIAACSPNEVPAGPAGPAGPQGPEGPQGPAGPTGEPGESSPAFNAEYVGSQTCAGCHGEIAQSFARSGHPWILNPIINNRPPDYPFSDIPNPPGELSWSQISYVIGGYRWKALFLDRDGNLITGDTPDFTNQYNLENNQLFTDPGWASYHAAESGLAYTCGACHTTGYSDRGNQDNRQGIVGTWAEPGVQCEACHGPGSLHAQNPRAIQMQIERDSEACERCHTGGPPAEVSEDFVLHHDEYGGMFQGKHQVLDCVECHDPHSGVVQHLERREPAVRVNCQECHFEEARFQKVDTHLRIRISCVQCHMPYLIENAVSQPEAHRADLRTHNVQIDPNQISQVDEQGNFLPQIALNSACRQCHNPLRGSPKTDEVLFENARGYHDQPAESAVPAGSDVSAEEGNASSDTNP